MDPIRNPYAPGAGQRPPELAGRDAAAARVRRRARAGGPRPARAQLVLTGLRGVGKTVLLNALRSAAVRRGWGTGKLEARPDQGLRRPLSQRAAPGRARARAPRRGVGRPRARRDPVVRPARGRRRTPSSATSGTRASTRRRSAAGPTPATSRSTSSSCSPTSAGWPPTVGKGIAVFIDEMQDLGPDDVSALCAACHEISQSGLPLIVVGAGLPHLPGRAVGREVLLRAALRLPADRPARPRAPPTWRCASPAEAEDAAYDDDALAALYAATGGYPYFIQAYGKTVWDLAPRSPITAADVAVAAPEAERELAVGLLRVAATSGRRRGSGSTCAPWPTPPSALVGRAARRSTRSSRCRPPRWPRCSARSRSRSRPRATRC